ncbi:hypothetical protein V1514DRAFT_284681 [Lipomyces japonicus]|uniref:uncharacterized protein n=1 Tax=Lipomyces japonicus TaxID=56871 RepID=UPI0034CFE99A
MFISDLAAVERINEATASVVTEFNDLVDLAPPAAGLPAAAAQSYEIECHTIALVRAIEDLLSLSRTLKDAWLLGQVSQPFKVTSTI